MNFDGMEDGALNLFLLHPRSLLFAVLTYLIFIDVEEEGDCLEENIWQPLRKHELSSNKLSPGKHELSSGR